MSNKSSYHTIAISEKDNWTVNFLYHTIAGRVMLKFLTRPEVSRAAGFVMDSPISSLWISMFIRNHSICLKDYKAEKYRSFNHFFTRKARKGVRSFSRNPLHVPAPCDGKLTAYEMNGSEIFRIKHSVYDVKHLLKNPALAREFSDGTCLIFRLTPDDYHRYCYIDKGRIISSRSIKGILHTVRPIALQQYQVYAQNAREYTVMETENFGKVIQMEIGALFVGRIKNHKANGMFFRGQEKGMFEFGGSTVLLLFQKNAIKVEEEILINTKKKRETMIKMGDKVGEKSG